jgi:rhodanese-related sulfurtransferase
MTARPIDERGLPEGHPFDPNLETTPREVRDGLANDNVLLIDVREAEELAVASVEGALHIPLGDLPSRYLEIDADEDTPIAVICHSGRRSLNAAMFLHQQGLTGARSVAGGIDLWSIDIDPSVPRY